MFASEYTKEQCDWFRACRYLPLSKRSIRHEIQVKARKKQNQSQAERRLLQQNRRKNEQAEPKTFSTSWWIQNLAELERRLDQAQ